VARDPSTANLKRRGGEERESERDKEEKVREGKSITSRGRRWGGDPTQKWIEGLSLRQKMIQGPTGGSDTVVIKPSKEAKMRKVDGREEAKNSRRDKM